MKSVMTGAFAQVAIVFSLCPNWVASAQETKPAFDVASVRRNTVTEPGDAEFQAEAGRLTVINNPIFGVIVNAYGISRNQLAGVPDWVRSERYNIEAQGPASAGRKEIMQMLQSLLAERFAMKAHFETREAPAYTLALAGGGHKLSLLSTEDCVPRAQPGAESNPNVCGSNNVSSAGGWNATRISMPGVVGSLSAILRQPVTDQTGIKGAFDIKLRWADDLAGANPDALPSVYTAVRETLGLELKPSRTQIEVLVIEHIERPSAN